MTGSCVFAEDASYTLSDLYLGVSKHFSRDRTWKPGKGLALEVSGIAIMPDGDPVICIRKGDLYRIRNVNTQPEFHLYATGLHEPLGLLQKDGDLYVTQRSEVTRIRDRDGDGTADAFDSFGSGWGLSGNYHEYAFGPALDRQGRMWVTLNIGIGRDASPWAAWRGWGGVIEDGRFKPLCAGMRSPSGLAANREGDVFAVDHQGNWFGTCPLYHLREGAFFGHRDSLAGLKRPDAPALDMGRDKAAGLPFPEAVRRIPALKPPAVWFPYEKTARGLTDVVLDDTEGRFGPFAGQLFVGEFTQASICRVFLEKVDGEWQGACFPFREGLASAVLSLCFGRDGSLFAGLSNRGWSSLGSASYGLQRLQWSGETPFAIKEMRARADGFELILTQPVEPASAMKADSFRMTSYTYTYHQAYGSPEIQTRSLKVKPDSISKDGLKLHLRVDGLRPMYVHELHATGLRNRAGRPLAHPEAYYTLNAIPGKRP
ncbi:MAG: hypothetical protein AAF492_00360 [Verrucomicrobiota bacterium]